MSAPTPPAVNHSARTAWRPRRRALLIATVAFALGLLLFLGLWMRDRSSGFYRAQAPRQGGAGRQFDPLPAPLPANEGGNASGMETPGADTDAMPRIVATPPPSPPPTAAPRAPPSPDPAVVPAATAPIPIQSPAPRYPPDALRRGETGTVLLRIRVGADGVPVAVDLMRSSRSRTLDRAAADSVRAWRFRPAQRDGRAVEGTVLIPIAFTTDR